MRDACSSPAGTDHREELIYTTLDPYHTVNSSNSAINPSITIVLYRMALLGNAENINFHSILSYNMLLHIPNIDLDVIWKHEL